MREVGPIADLSGRRVAFTTPASYAGRLARLLHVHGVAALHVPSISVGPSPSTMASLRSFLLPRALDPFAALAFTSRNAISSLSLSLSHAHASPPLSPSSADAFTVAALGSDADLLLEGGRSLLSLLCPNPDRIRILVPETATPAGLVDSLGKGSGRRVLCPVPLVAGLQEPSVIPEFLALLEAAEWVPVRVPAYETRWAGPQCAEPLVGLEGKLDAIVFTSSAEVEGLLKGLEAVGWDWEKVRRRWPEMVVAAHGPVTAKGVERFGVAVDVVGLRFGSFHGVVNALASWFRARSRDLGEEGFPSNGDDYERETMID